ncbi:hypothetical protein [Enterovirga sp.]|jgi:hypothetical protein|uniref:hypothetical protein n=1 Tax=Enterovirga sp. TaxID=2026350 RepID=UPI0026294272|nr:hypothetical protein [Enterovirga sp.]MDB5591188.1 hypothetical protein [Enterovirga sp.]
MRPTHALAAAALTGMALALAGSLPGNSTSGKVAGAASPEWAEVAWPFPDDPWAKGKAFRCRARHCGTEVTLYLRPKIGACNCVTTVDDDDVERIGDLDLLGAHHASLGPGRPIRVRWMNGRSRAYARPAAQAAPRSALAIAFHDRCDMIVATAAVAGEDPAAQEQTVLDFLNGEAVLRWAEVRLGL